MSKRTRLDEAAHEARPRAKKFKPDTEPRYSAAEAIVSARELSRLFSFQQDEARSLQNIGALKAFISSILHPENPDDVPRRRAILREYFESQKPHNVEGETESVYLADLMQTWSLAATSNSDMLMSAVTSTVDQLLKVLSSDIDSRSHGLLLCKTLLQQAQLRILSRSISSPRHKEHVIGPALRVLKEVVSFDGGVLARQLYSKRDLAFEAGVIAKCLTYRKVDAEGPEDIVKKPSLRTTTVRYVLANLRFQDDGAKADMLQQSNMMRMLIDGIQSDHPRVISEILRSLNTYVIQDAAIPRRNKGFFFNDRNLLSMCQLYRVDLDAEDKVEDTTRKPLSEEAHDFIVTACTSFDAGALRGSSWYPPSNNELGPEKHVSDEQLVDLGLDGISWYGQFDTTVPVRNKSLSGLILQLRPYAYDRERQLLMAIFEAAPELVAWYYRRMAQTFPFTPKLTATWIGYAATLFSTIQLPLPQQFSRMSQTPPPVSIMVDNILPSPLDQKALRACLVNSDLSRIFAVRILIASFEKLRSLLKVLRDKAEQLGTLWEEAAEKLTKEFCQRCPTLQDITKLYGSIKNASEETSLKREATLRLMALYYEVIPQLALDEDYDVSIPLTATLETLEKSTQHTQHNTALLLIELGHLIKISTWSPSVHWWQKAKGLSYSPFVALLRLIARSPAQDVFEIKTLIEDILKSNQLLGQKPSNDDGPTPLDALLISLKYVDQDESSGSSESVYAFLDQCITRYAKRPIKYVDDMDALLEKSSRPLPTARLQPSLLLMTLVEQWPFVQKDKKLVAAWMNSFITSLDLAGDSVACSIDQESLFSKKEFGNLWSTKQSKDAGLGLIFDDYKAASQSANLPSNPEETRISLPNGDGPPTPQLQLTDFQPMQLKEDQPVLARYRKKDLDSLIDDGDLSELIQCLLSHHYSIRIQAVNALRAVMTTISSSNHMDKDILYMLIGELMETCTEFDIGESPLLGLATMFASRAVHVLKDPTHALYVKINEYLNKGPSWRVRGMCAYWLEQVLLHPPADADAEGSYWREVVWVLEWLYDGLRTMEDFDILRRNGGIFEKLMALFFHPTLEKRRIMELTVDAEKLNREPGLQAQVRPMILRIIGRAAVIDGATILVTGMGVLSWLDDVQSLITGEKRGIALLQELKKGILDRADAEKLKEWSGLDSIR